MICSEPRKFEYGIQAKPQLQPGYAIIKIKRIGICGTDLHAFEGTQPYFSYPRILGHELAGELVEFDTAPGFETKEAVTFIPYFDCGKCIACRNGKHNCCVNMQVCGVHVDGGMVEYLSVPSSSLIHGQGLGYDELALVEPLSIGAHGVRRANIRVGESVLVIGPGPSAWGQWNLQGSQEQRLSPWILMNAGFSFAKTNLMFLILLMRCLTILKVN